MNTDNTDTSYPHANIETCRHSPARRCQTYLRAPIVRKQTQKQTSRHIKQRCIPIRDSLLLAPSGSQNETGKCARLVSYNTEDQQFPHMTAFVSYLQNSAYPSRSSVRLLDTRLMSGRILSPTETSKIIPTNCNSQMAFNRLNPRQHKGGGGNETLMSFSEMADEALCGSRRNFA